MGKIINRGLVLLFLFLAAVSTTACSRRVPGVSTQSPGKVGIMYTVHKGDSLWNISRMYSVPTDELVRLNNLRDASKIKAGERLFIPGHPRLLEKNRRHYLKYDSPAERPARTAEAPNAPAGSSGNKSRTTSPKPPKKPLGKKPTKYYSTRLKFGWPVKGSVTGRFGTNTGKHNNGLEIAVSGGVPIKASEEGEVVYLGEITGYGLTMILAHSDDFYTLYSPMKSAAFSLGEIAGRGQQIAECGNRHFHFEIRKGKIPLDPMLYLK